MDTLLGVVYSSIHDYPVLNNVEKFNYLLSLLRCIALDTIVGLSLIAVNYKEAILLLEKQFGSKQHIISCLMDALMDLSAVTSADNLKALCSLHDNMELH